MIQSDISGTRRATHLETLTTDGPAPDNQQPLNWSSTVMSVQQAQHWALTLWSAEGRTWAGSGWVPCPGRWGPAAPWGSWGSSSGRWRRAPSPPLPASCHRTLLASPGRWCTHPSRGCSWLLWKTEQRPDDIFPVLSWAINADQPNKWISGFYCFIFIVC